MQMLINSLLRNANSDKFMYVLTLQLSYGPLQEEG